MTFRPLRDLLRGQIQKQGMSNAITASQVLEVARTVLPQTLGSQSARYCQPAIFKNGVLHIKIANAVAAQEVFMQNSVLVAALNKALGQELVQAITIGPS